MFHRAFLLAAVVALPSFALALAQTTGETGGGKPIKKEVVAKDQPKEIVNSIGMKLAYIPAGTFLMGSPNVEVDRLLDEGPQREVRISKGFYMGVYTVTQEEYQKVMGKNPSWFSPDGEGKSKVANLDTRKFPVDSVSWDDATDFCKKLSAKEGKSYRLPTEAEWEYSCRAGTTSPFYFGETLSTDQANYNGNFVYDMGREGVNRQQPTAVGSFPANAFGLYDMHGNVWQWCEDWYDRTYYANAPNVDPVNNKAGDHRVLRGGCWNLDPGLCRSAFRNDYEPGEGVYNFSFRVVLVAH